MSIDAHTQRGAPPLSERFASCTHHLRPFTRAPGGLACSEPGAEGAKAQRASSLGYLRTRALDCTIFSAVRAMCALRARHFATSNRWKEKLMGRDFQSELRVAAGLFVVDYSVGKKCPAIS